jgi:hypothetical protein
MIFGAIKRAFGILSNPKKEFENINKRTFESVLADYMILLVAVAVLAGLSSLIYSIVRVLYLDMTLDISVQYLRMINYSVGRSVSLLFFYLFGGTFLLFFLSTILRFLLRKIKYISLLKILFYSLTPFLLFSWFLPTPLPLGVWSIFLLITGIKTHKNEHIKKNSIKKRD